MLQRISVKDIESLMSSERFKAQPRRALVLALAVKVGKHHWPLTVELGCDAPQVGSLKI